MSSPVVTFHKPIVKSSDPDVKYSPFGENPTVQTISLWPLRLFMRSLVSIFHNPIVESQYPDAKYKPFGENTTLVT